MNQGSTLGRARSLERQLVELKGIRKVRVDIADEGVFIEVLAIPELSERRIRARILRMARASLGPDVKIAGVRIFVAASTRQRIGSEPPRRKLTSLITRRTREHFATQVILARDGDVATGESTCPPDHHPERTVAQAVLDGLHEVSERPLQLQDVETVRLGEETCAVVSLNFGERELIGTAEVRFDLTDAIVRATLHALNRSLSYAR